MKKIEKEREMILQVRRNEIIQKGDDNGKSRSRLS